MRTTTYVDELRSDDVLCFNNKQHEHQGLFRLLAPLIHEYKTISNQLQKRKEFLCFVVRRIKKLNPAMRFLRVHAKTKRYCLMDERNTLRFINREIQSLQKALLKTRKGFVDKDELTDFDILFSESGVRLTQKGKRKFRLVLKATLKPYQAYPLEFCSFIFLYMQRFTRPMRFLRLDATNGKYYFGDEQFAVKEIQKGFEGILKKERRRKHQMNIATTKESLDPTPQRPHCASLAPEKASTEPLQEHVPAPKQNKVTNNDHDKCDQEFMHEEYDEEEYQYMEAMNRAMEMGLHVQEDCDDSSLVEEV